MALLVALTAVSAAAAGPVAAQVEDDPYGPTSTTESEAATATLELTVESGPRGTEVGVFACGYADDAPAGSVTFDGEVVLSDLVVDADGCLTTADGAGRSSVLAARLALRAQAGAPVAFRVPEDARPGNRNVCGVAAGYNTACQRFQVRQDAEVAGVTVENEQGAAGGGSGLIGGSLPRTGLAIGVLLAIAGALLLAGRRLLAESRRRRGTAY